MLAERPTDDLQGSRRPVVTWVLMSLATVITVLLPFWSAAWGFIIVFVMISVLMEL